MSKVRIGVAGGRRKCQTVSCAAENSSVFRWTLKVVTIAENSILFCIFKILIWSVCYLQNTFYRAMHCSAKRGIAIPCRLSVCDVNVCDVGGSGPHRLDNLETNNFCTRTISPTPSLFVAQRPSTYSQGNIGKFGGDQRWGGEKWRAGAQKRQYL